MWTLSKFPEHKQIINKVSVSDYFVQFCRCVYLLEVFIKVLIESILATTISFYDYNKVLQYCKSYLNLIIDSFLNKIFKII